MSTSFERGGTSSRFERSTCLFPSSSKNAAATGRNIIKRSLLIDGLSSPSTNLVRHAAPAVLQCAWALTLQCFIVADVLCFGYGGSHDLDGAVYILRLDLSESVQSFVARLQQSQRAATATRSPAGYEIDTVKGESSDHQCNTAIGFHAGRELGDMLPSETRLHQQMDLKLIVSQVRDNEVVLELDYRLSHTHEDVAASVLGTFQHIFAQITRTSDKLLIRDLDLCPPCDRKKIQKFTNNVSPVDSRCLHDLIIEQCRRQPHRTAIESWDGNLSYGELEDLSGRLAAHLVNLGVRPETFVLCCFEKSTWAIVARLAILRAGGAYISMHASNPPVYLDSVINRTKTTILVTDSQFADQFRDVVSTLVELSPKWLRSLPMATQTSTLAEVQPGNACLILFTSGSTGTPKGIVQIHSSYAIAIQDYARNLRLGSHTRFLHFDDYAFDISNLEFLVPLILGGVCCVPAPMKTVEDLALQIRLLKANIIFLTPTVAIRLEPTDVPCLQTMCVGGEPLPKDLVRKWANSPTRLVNQYGMGEVAICCAYNDRVDDHEGSKIGRPSSGAIWIVDPMSPERLLPIGATGELIIEGPHLSRGYIDSTNLQRTEAGFLKITPRWVTELHPDRAIFRLYRSGDLGRLNADGTITYLGRKDTILKIDGCRVDALEVEHQARKYLSDKDTVVVDLLGVINGQADPSLTAFLYLDEHPLSGSPVPHQAPVLYDAVGDQRVKAKIEQIKNGIGLTLPPYMIPTTFLLMAWTPRTASKKIDRQKIHVLGQRFYSGILEQRTKDIDYAQRMRLLPM